MRKILIILVALFCLLATNSYALEKQIPQSEQDIQLSFAPLVKKAAPAVVNIYTNKRVKVRALSPFFNDPVFNHFFGNKNFGGRVTEKVEKSLGSGVIIRGDGVIVTNNHVVEGASEIFVVLNDRSEYTAQVILLDPKTDLALLKIDVKKEELPYLEFMDSDELEVGDLVLAIGNPFGIGQTVTSGIVSAVARTTLGISDYQFFIQTDAAINPGNSGGALINMEGKLAGINTAIFSKSGGSNGLGFTIPANMVSSVVKNSAGIGRVIRPWLGVSMQKIPKDVVKKLGKKKFDGAIITSMHKLGSAFRSGLKVGDIVTYIDSHKVVDEKDLAFRVATYETGSKAKFVVLRNGKKKKVFVKMLPPPEIPKRDLKLIQGSNPLSGVIVANLSPALSDELGLKNIGEGVIVIKLNRGFASSIGIKKYDIIRKINDQDINLTSELEDIISGNLSRWKITLERGGRLLNIIWSTN